MQQNAEFVIKAVRSLDQFFEKCIQKKVEQSGITLPQMRVIKEVVTRQGICIKQLSQNLHMTQSTVSGIVERLIHKGYLTKRTNPDDKRFAEIRYTNDVTEFLERHSTEFVSEAVGEVFNHLQPSDLKLVIQGLQLLLSAVETAKSTTN